MREDFPMAEIGSCTTQDGVLRGHIKDLLRGIHRKIIRTGYGLAQGPGSVQPVVG